MIVRIPKKQVTLIIVARSMFLFLPVLFFVYECVLEHKFIKINFVRYIVI